MAGSYLKLFVDCLDRCQKLNDAEFGRLIRAALSYKATGVEVELMGREELLWDGMKLDIDRDNKSYTETVKARSEAGKKGASARWKTDSKNSKCQSSYSKNSKCHFEDGKNGQDKDKEKDKDNISPPHTPPLGGWGVPDGPLLSALKAFEEMRKRIKKPMTQRARELLLGNLKKLSSDEGEQVKILEQSILKGWQDVYPLHDRSEPAGKVTSYDLDLIKATMMGVPK